MLKLNEHRIVKRRNGFFPFNYERHYWDVSNLLRSNSNGMLQIIIGDGIQLLLLLKRPMNGLKKLENVFINTMGIEYERSFYPYN